MRRHLRRGVAAIPTPTKPNWTMFYFRGICFERAKQWPKAEADLKKALELYPDQPHVLIISATPGSIELITSTRACA
jgi:Tfp pilus assembly protein PilF